MNHNYQYKTYPLILTGCFIAANNYISDSLTLLTVNCVGLLLISCSM